MKVKAPKGFHWMKQKRGSPKLMKHTGKYKPHKGASLYASFDVQKRKYMAAKKRKKTKPIRRTTKGKNANYRSTKSGAGMTAKGRKKI